jgi:hypothetical protein
MAEVARQGEALPHGQSLLFVWPQHPAFDGATSRRGGRSRRATRASPDFPTTLEPWQVPSGYDAPVRAGAQLVHPPGPAPAATRSPSPFIAAMLTEPASWKRASGHDRPNLRRQD